jgi:Putative prokaryotic signal transducing protein
VALVELARFYNGFEAGIVQSRLTSEGIDSFLFDTQMNWGGLDGLVIPVRLMVDDDDLAQARRHLA